MKTKNILLITVICFASQVACAQFTTTLIGNSPGCIFTLQGTFSAICTYGSGSGWCNLEKQNGGNWDVISTQSHGWNCGTVGASYTFSFTLTQPTNVSGTYRLNMWYTNYYDCNNSSGSDPCNYQGTGGQTYLITFYAIPTACYTINGISGCTICNCSALPSTGGGVTTAPVNISCSTGDLYGYNYTLDQVSNTCGFIANASSSGGLLSGGTSFTITGLAEGNNYTLKVYLFNHCLNTSATVSKSFHWGRFHRMESIDESEASLVDIELYPNPTLGIIQMKNLPASGTLNVSLVNSFGEVININNLFNKGLNSLNLDQYPDGIYSVVFENGTERVSKRVALLR
jgi:hypothetical protein